MHRLIVAFLAAVDAAIAVAVGLAATLAPLTVLWVFGLGGTADWGVLWPAAVTVWQFGNLVPLDVTLPSEYLAATGIDGAAASFTLSLAPLAFATFTTVFAARSGVRASRADAWLTGVLTGSAVFAALATGAALTSGTAVAQTSAWQAILFPVLLFAVPATLAAVVTEWRESGAGVVARVRDRVETAPHGWADAPALIARGSAVVVVGLVGAGAAIAAIAVFARAGQIVALYQAANVDVVGAIVLTLGQLVYIPTLAVWGASFVAGPGFMVGTATSVSPAATQVGVVPGIPALGAIPESTTPWLLLLALIPVALGAFAGWIARSRLVGARSATAIDDRRMPRPGAAAVGKGASAGAAGASGATGADAARTTVLEGLLSASSASAASAAAASAAASDPSDVVAEDLGMPRGEDSVGARLVIAIGIAVVSAAGAGLLALVASGSLGPGRLASVGPAPGPVALAVGAEVLLGAAILLLSPRPRRDEHRARISDPQTAAASPPQGFTERAPEAPAHTVFEPLIAPIGEPAADARSDEALTEPIDLDRRD